MVKFLPLLAVPCLVAGVAGGLLRAGVVSVDAAWLGHAAVSHAALMLCAFFGTVIGVERAVAVKERWTLAAPLASGCGGLALLGGWHTAGAVLLTMAAMVFCAVNVRVLQRQAAAHTWLLLAAALAWLAGSTGWLYGWGSPERWWFTFLVVTIAAERLEMTRLTRRPPWAAPALVALVAGLMAGSAAGDAAFGAALLLLAAWLAVFDIARRTIRTEGLSRFMAACLLAGYAWLGVAGGAWMTGSRDLALHALGLGFVFSMVMGHAPVILPAITRLRMAYTPLFYLPLGLLHASLLVRAGWREQGAALNAAALVVFAILVGWRLARTPQPAA